MRIEYVGCRELRTAAEVRAHATIVQKRINARRYQTPPPVAKPPTPPPPVPVTPYAVAPPPPPPQGEVVLELPEQPVRTIMRVAANYHGLPLSLVVGDGRRSRVMIARHIGFFVAHRLGMSLTRIGRAANRDHTSVLHAYRGIEKRLVRGDDRLAEAVDVIGHLAAAVVRARWREVSTKEVANVLLARMA